MFFTSTVVFIRLNVSSGYNRAKHYDHHFKTFPLQIEVNNLVDKATKYETFHILI